ncbi:ABC transporter ATP-binding protein [Nesterenkonia flava]|uniref:ABC transporter ATP-binding protein n=1 Tax=Nesterenkonia flava TaxID=469799 RepID=A0ABU1FU10_9MICC|nr:ABC transporter ATP-binding protein [Nesterenkonia flava]MDR5712146.1 ABC transporter ATP-binding protein [Nesterenkonia flava]
MNSDERLLDYREVTIANRMTGEHIVHGFTASLRRGEVLGIVGESGSGKSITCRSILGILPRGFDITEGTAEVLGQDLRNLSAKGWLSIRGVRVGAVFQDPGSYLNPSIRVGPQIAEPLRVRRGLKRGEAKERVLDLFASVHLADPADLYQRYSYELSGGMLQRILIAGALALEPEVLIADEATTALDVTVQAEILDLLEELKEKTGVALVVVSHDLAVVGRLCDRILVMRHGQIIDQGSTRQVLFEPAHEYTRLLVSEHQVYGLDRFLAAERSAG